VTQPVAIVTGASSGVGLYATKALVDQVWHVVMACRDLPRAAAAAAGLGIAGEQVRLQQVDLASLESVRAFLDVFRATGRSMRWCVTRPHTSPG